MTASLTRDELIQELKQLPPHSRKRIGIEYVLKEKTYMELLEGRLASALERKLFKTGAAPSQAPAASGGVCPPRASSLASQIGE